VFCVHVKQTQADQKVSEHSLTLAQFLRRKHTHAKKS
jgi:hypothetical protein